ncbi:MAG TPA: xanthine dehydrogenase family protein molybdopterin-binding subunit [Roseiflexaceae bacterium]|nr:xanthine dehydrogenase family protein molybdopterin-binding subunit [Roseiflexaceae bacterium]
MTAAEDTAAEPTSVVGRRALRAEGRGLVSGRTTYVIDTFLPGMLTVKLKLSPHPNARIVRIDTSLAAALDGVVAIITHKDVPHNRHGLSIPDQPVLCDEFVRHIGDPVAAVAAVDELRAMEAVNLIEVEYDVLPTVADPLLAMQPGAPVIHEGGNTAPVNDKHDHRIVRLGDVERAFAEADLVVESVYSTQVREHAPMETHVSVAEVDPTGKVVIYTCSQAPHLHQMFLSQVLKLPLHKVRMVGGRVGGGFGAKNDLCIDHITALLALKAGRPVKLALTREEECLHTSKDQAYARLRFRSAVKKDGTIIGRAVEAVQDTGAYNVFGNGGIEKMGVYCRGPYNIPNYWFDGWVVYTNKPPSGAMRGFNVADAHFAYEVHTEEIARALGMDSLELRWRNFIRAGDPSSTHVPVVDSTIRECCAAAAEVFGWALPGEQGSGTAAARPRLPQADNPYKKRGIGVCAGFQGTGATGGSDPGMAEIEVMGDGSVVCRVGVTEIGAGEGTVLAMMAAEELGVPLGSVTMTLGDTEHTPYDTGTFGNRVTYINGKAVRKAAREARQIICGHAAGLLGLPAEELAVADGVVFSTARPEQRIALGRVAGAAQQGGNPIIGRAGYVPDARPLNPDTGEGKPSEQTIYAFAIIAVEVDTRTGLVEILRSVLVHDVGKAINPLFVEGQMDGGHAFGIAMALMEDFYPDYPRLTRAARGLHEYKIMTALDMPDDHTNIIIEIPSASGPFGAKSIGEYTANLQAPAIINAIYDATGVWVRDLPATPEKLLRLLRAEGKNRRGAEAGR